MRDQRGAEAIAQPRPRLPHDPSGANALRAAILTRGRPSVAAEVGAVLVLLLLQPSTPTDPGTLHAVRLKVRDAMMKAGLRGHDLDGMEVAVGEVLSNVNLHAYGADGGPVSVAVSRLQDAVTVVITDRGDATVAPEVPRLPARTTTGGRGLYLTSRLVDDLTIRVNRVGRGLRVRLTKRFNEAGVATGGEATRQQQVIK